MSNDPLKNWQLQEGNEPLDQWKLQDAEQDARHLQLQQGGATSSDWQPVEYQRTQTRSGRNWVLPSIVIVALLVALGYVGFVSLNRLGLDGLTLGLPSFGVLGSQPTPTPTETATEELAPAAVTEAPTGEPTPAEAPPTPTPTAEPPTPTPALITTRIGTVNQAAGVNARREPSTTGEIVRLLNNGERVTVVRQEGDWLLVILPENEAAWVWAEYFDQAVGEQKTLDEWNAILTGVGLPPVAVETSAGQTPEAPSIVTLNVAVIADPGATLRIEPATQAQVVGEALLGATLTASGRTDTGEWLLVTLADGRRGWIAANLVSVDGDATTLAVQPANLLLTEDAASTPALATPTPALIGPAFTLETSGVVPAAPFTNTLPPIGPAIAISDTAGVRARSAPSLEGNVLGVVPNGAVLPVVGRSADNAWVQVTLPDNQRAWVFREVVNVSSDIDTAPVVGADGAVAIPTPTVAAPAGELGEPTLTVKSLLGANVRTAPNNEAETIDTVSLGAAFPAIGRSADDAWIQVQLPDGVVGWILANTAELNVDIATLPVAP
ncbi:MAG: SH3 domain-containing protein [Caldilinea sp.]